MFSLQLIDRMLVQEEMSCVDRLVNPYCTPRWGRTPSVDDLGLDPVTMLKGGDFSRDAQQLEEERALFQKNKDAAHEFLTKRAEDRKKNKDAAKAFLKKR